MDGRDATGSLGVSRRLKSDVVIDSLGLKILSGEIAPGELLQTEAELTESLGVSRPSPREGLRALAFRGLVKARTRHGTTVLPKAHWDGFDPDVLRWLSAAPPQIRAPSWICWTSRRSSSLRPPEWLRHAHRPNNCLPLRTRSGPWPRPSRGGKARDPATRRTRAR